MNNLKVTISGDPKTGKSYLASALKEIFKEVFTKVTVTGNVDLKTQDQISECYKNIVDSPITIEEVHTPTPTGNLVRDLFVLGFDKDSSLSINDVLHLEISNNLVYIVVKNKQNINRPTLVGKYDFYKVLDLINSLKSFK